MYKNLLKWLSPLLDAHLISCDVSNLTDWVKRIITFEEAPVNIVLVGQTGQTLGTCSGDSLLFGS
jgi:hypothetical protein